MNINNLKKSAAIEAVNYVQNNQILGLGTGSTVFFVLEEISTRIADGRLKNIKGIPSSNQTFELANKFGIPLTTLDENPKIDLNIDGADEVDEELNLIKGGGGALLREKIIAQASRKNIFVVDENKLSKTLGEKFYLPIEVVPFAMNSVMDYLNENELNPQPRVQNGKYFLTDQNNFIVDLFCGKISDTMKLNLLLKNRAGIVEHGLFLGLTNMLIIGKQNKVEVIHNPKL